MLNIKNIFNSIGLNKGQERTVRAKKNIVASLIIKGLNIAIGLILVPLTISYLNPTKYGIWITLSSVISWFGFFDIGLGNGLRNRFAEALANNNKELAKTYVSTTYAVLSIIISLVLLFFYLINPFINWVVILNAGNEPGLQNELSTLALIVFTFFCLRFIFKLIGTILTADQQPAKASLFELFSNAIILFFIIILTRILSSSLIYLGLIFSSIPVIVFFIVSLWFFNGKYRYYKPAIKFINFGKAKDLFSLGIKFFIVQISVVLLYQTNNIIISQLFGPSEVTPYNIAFKYFSIIMMVFSIILLPFWSAFTEAWVKKEMDWIKLVMKKLFKIWGILLLLAIFMLVLSPIIYKIWIGKAINIPTSMSALVGLWIILNCWNGIFSQFLNGISKIKLQVMASIILALLNVPLSLYMGKIYGVNGILGANIILGSIAALIYTLQYKKVINNKAHGIWNK